MKSLFRPLAALITALLISYLPALKGSEENIVGVLMAVYAVAEVYRANKNKANVKQIQTDLRQAGYKGKIDGLARDKTKIAVRKAIAVQHGIPSK